MPRGRRRSLLKVRTKKVRNLISNQKFTQINNSGKKTEPRAPKPPNWRLKPNPAIKVLELDPLLETKTDLPFVNAHAHGKLAIRAVLMRDYKLLAECCNNTKVRKIDFGAFLS